MFKNTTPQIYNDMYMFLNHINDLVSIGLIYMEIFGTKFMSESSVQEKSTR